MRCLKYLDINITGGREHIFLQDEDVLNAIHRIGKFNRQFSSTEWPEDVEVRKAVSLQLRQVQIFGVFRSKAFA
eukprot:scaffold2280_cov114-Skeletonema_marinoi.AAC.2